MNFKKIFFIVALVSVNAGYAMVRPLADIAAPVALNTMLAAMDTPQRWVGVERNLDDERFGTNEVEKLTQALLRSRDIPWFLNKTLEHRSSASSASFSPDGRSVVTGSWDGTARIWDAATGAFVRTLQGHQGMVYSASFSPDGRSVVTASLDRTARIWECGFTDQSVAIKLYLTQLL